MPASLRLIAARGERPGAGARYCRDPAPEFFASALAGMELAAEQVAMVGDDVESDIGGALSAGLGGLVRTGKFRADALRRATPQPTAVVESIADVPALLE